MLLNQLVKINEEALVANAVSFDLMDDREKNLRLCKGFVFNYDSDPNKLKFSTVGVLRALRRSFHSYSEPNIHLMVQDYGKGKSHFALAVANFFQQPYNSEEVQGILQQVDYATSSDRQILYDLKEYKQRGRHLVICLSGDKPIDLQKHFLQALRKTLDLEGITDSLGSQMCQQPLQYLENLDAKQIQEAEAFLAELGHPEGDLNMIMQLLRKDSYEVVPRVRDISRKLTGTGIPLDFEADIDVEAILSDLITQLCTGENPRFQGILILFDELYNYLQRWADDPVRAGSTTLQNITNVCEKFKQKIALLCLTQRRPGRVTPPKNTEDYNRLVSRLELLPSTYEPAASLELVLDGLLTQQEKTVAWQEFDRKWRTTLIDINTNIFQNRTANYYQNRNWTLPKFFKQITLGCFPLHPLTSYLLCNLDFTQGRTAIEFVQEDVKKFIQAEPVEKDGNLNVIYPVALVDAFESNFANAEYSTLFSDYIYSANKVKTSADATLEETIVLKALLLFYASGGKLTKSDREQHEIILSLLTGLSSPKVKNTLDKLCQNREVIYHNPADNTYRFYAGGFGIDELRRRIKEEAGNKTAATQQVETHCQIYIYEYIGQDTIPTHFIESNRLCSEDWRFENQVFTVAKFRQALSTNQILKNLDASGVMAYIIGETDEELLTLRNEVSGLLAHSSSKGQVVVAIASQPVGKLKRLLLEESIANQKLLQDFGTALIQLRQQYQKQIGDITADLFKSCTYYCHIQDKIPASDRHHLSKIVSAILQDRYPYVPPVEKNDKMALKSTAGSKIISFVSKRLLEDDLRQVFPDKSYDNIINPVFVNSWRLLKLVSQKYSVVIPTQPNVRAAWHRISELTNLGESSQKSVDIAKIWETLSNPPYGYHEYTFTILFVSWLAYHRSEVLLRGGFGIPQRKTESVTVRTEAVKNWVNTNVFDKPKDFVNVWIKSSVRPSLIRRKPFPCPEVPNSVDYDRATQFIQEIENYLSNTPDAVKVDELKKTQQKLKTGTVRIQQFLELIVQAENSLPADIDVLLRFCSQLHAPLPIIHEDGLSIDPTAQQEIKRTEVLQEVIEKIGQFVETEELRTLSLQTPIECGSYKAKLQILIDKIQQVNHLPSRFIETLQSAIQASDIKLAEIEEQKKIETCLESITSLYNSLSALATQSEFVDIYNRIACLVTAVPAVYDTKTYKDIIQDLQEKQDALIEQMTNWRNQFSPAMSRPQAIQLHQNINRQLNRYTEEASQLILTRLLMQLDDIILERETEEQEEQEILTLVVSARQKLQTVKTQKNLSDAFQVYQELRQLQLPSVAIASIDAETELTQLQAEGYTVISGKISQVLENCKQQVEGQSEYDRLKDSLQCIQTIVAQEEFASLRDSLIEADQNLEAEYENLQKTLQHRKILESIRQYTPTKTNTVHLCEEAIGTITHLSNQLNPNQFQSEIEKLLQEFTNKITNYKANLQKIGDRLSQVETSKQINSIREEYAKLDFIFRDSTEYTYYQQLQTQIQQVAEDIERVCLWENLYQQSHSIADCDRVLESIDTEQTNINNIERFRDKFQAIKKQLLQKKQGYIEQLNELSGKLTNVKSLKEIQKLQAELTNKSTYYRESQAEQRYQEICAEVNQMGNLLQISATQESETVEACQAEKERLLKWRQEQITPNVQSLLDSLLNNLEQTQQQIQNQQREAAKKWFSSLKALYQDFGQYTNDDTRKLAAVNDLSKKIKKQKHQYEPLLEVEQKQTLAQILNDCREIQNQDKESKIFVLFQELPRKKRENLLKKLAEYLSDITEES